MFRRVDRLADIRDRRGDPRRCLVVDDADSLDLVRLVGAQALLDALRIGAGAPVGFQEFRLQPQFHRHVLPQGGEMSGLVHEDFVAAREHVRKRCLPGTRPRRREYEHGAGSLEYRLDAGKHALANLLEFRPAMIDHRAVHGAQDAVRHGRRAGDLKEVTSRNSWGIGWHRWSFPALKNGLFFHMSRPCAQGRGTS